MQIVTDYNNNLLGTTVSSVYLFYVSVFLSSDTKYWEYRIKALAEARHTYALGMAYGHESRINRQYSR